MGLFKKEPPVVPSTLSARIMAREILSIMQGYPKTSSTWSKSPLPICGLGNLPVEMQKKQWYAAFWLPPKFTENTLEELGETYLIPMAKWITERINIKEINNTAFEVPSGVIDTSIEQYRGLRLRLVINDLGTHKSNIEYPPMDWCKLVAHYNIDHDAYFPTAVCQVTRLDFRRVLP